MDGNITRAEHEEFCKRIEAESRRLSDEDNRQNRRIEALENSIREFGSIAASVEKLATNMESMVKEQEKQGRRLERLENRDGDLWRTAVKYALSALIGGVIAFALARMGLT